MRCNCNSIHKFKTNTVRDPAASWGYKQQNNVTGQCFPQDVSNSEFVMAQPGNTAWMLWRPAALLIFLCLLLKLVQHVGRCGVTRLMRGDLPITIRTQVEIWARKVDTGLVHICEDRDTNCEGRSNNMWGPRAMGKIAAVGEKRGSGYSYQWSFN